MILLDENVEVLHDLGLGKMFLEIIVREISVKEKNDKLCFIKTTVKKNKTKKPTSQEIKRQARHWEIIFANHAPNK